MIAPDLAPAETDPAGFVLAVAELRDELIRGTYLPPEIAAWHAAEVALWRAVVEEHQQFYGAVRRAGSCQPERPTVLLLAVVAAAKAYLEAAA